MPSRLQNRPIASLIYFNYECVLKPQLPTNLHCSRTCRNTSWIWRMWSTDKQDVINLGTKETLSPFYRHGNKVGSLNDLFKVSKDICSKARIFIINSWESLKWILYDKQVIQVIPTLIVHSFMLQFYPE